MLQNENFEVNDQWVIINILRTLELNKQ